MQLYIPHAWVCFSVLMGIVLVTSYIMGRQGSHFFTLDVMRRRFSIMDLELPASSREMFNLVQGIYALPEKEVLRVTSALRAQLYTDFLFMPAAYGAIFVLCMQVSLKAAPGEAGFFSVLAWLQGIAWLCDITENIFLLAKIRKAAKACGNVTFGAYRCLEVVKWGLSLFGVVSGLATAYFFWLSGI